MTASDTPQVAPDLIVAHVEMIHKLAMSMAGKGKVVMTGFGEDPNQPNLKTGKPGRQLAPRVTHAVAGDVRQTVVGISQIANLRHYNVYMPLAIFPLDLRVGTKGYERDVIACLGIVADFDDPDAARWAERLPVPPNYVLETSAGRFQAFYLFDKPEALSTVKPVAARLKAVALCDHGTSDMSHVWRVPGALNWPNAKKVAEGRPREPQLVRVAKAWDGDTISLQALSDALPQDEPNGGRKDSTAGPKESTSERDDSKTQSSATGGDEQPKEKAHSTHRAAIDGTPENLDAMAQMQSLPPELQDEIRQPAQADRSKAIFKVVARLIKQGLDDKTIENVIHAHPKGIGAKYTDRDHLDKEIARIRAKTATRPVVQVGGGNLPAVIDQAEEHLIEADHDLFQRGSLIVRPVQDRIPIPGGSQIVETRLVPVRLPQMREKFSEAADFQRLDRRSGTWFSIDCPRDVAETYLEREGKWRLPRLTRIVNAPTLRADGSVLQMAGYDEATGLLFDPQGVEFPPVPQTPDLEELISAVDLLLAGCGKSRWIVVSLPLIGYSTFVSY